MTYIHVLHGVCVGCSLQMLGGGGSQEPKTFTCRHSGAHGNCSCLHADLPSLIVLMTVVSTVNFSRLTGRCSHWCRRRALLGGTNTNLPGFECDLLGSPGHLMLPKNANVTKKKSPMRPKKSCYCIIIYTVDNFQMITCTFYYAPANRNTLNSAACW